MKYLVCLFLIFLASVSCQKTTKQELFVNTVIGKIPTENLGFTLTHEHIVSNFGAPRDSVLFYDESALLQQVVPYLKKIKNLGIQTIFDCTASNFGRNVRLLQQLSDSSGIQIVTNTGWYAAANDRYVPAIAFEDSIEEIANGWIDEFENGIEGTNIKPGFIKLAFDDGNVSEIDIKLFEAGIQAHLKTGLTLAVHTGKNIKAAHKQLELLEKYKVDPTAWIWVHANQVQDEKILLEAAAKGAWISLDGVRDHNIEAYLETIALFKKQQLLHKVLLSHDGNTFPRGGKIRPYEAISKMLIPKLLETGYTQKEIQQLMVANPQKAFGI